MDIVAQIKNMKHGESVVYYTVENRPFAELSALVGKLYDAGTHIPHIKLVSRNYLGHGTFDYIITRKPAPFI